MTPKQVSEETGLKIGTVKPAMRRMSESGMIVRVGVGRYSLLLGQ